MFQVSSSGAAARDGRLQVGMRILEVNHQSLLGMTHTEAVQILRGVGDALLVLVCDGFDPKAAAAIEVSVGCTCPGVTCTPTCIPPLSSQNAGLSQPSAVNFFGFLRSQVSV